MADRFLVVRFDDGNPVATPHSTSADAFDRAKELFQEHGQDVEVEIHLNQVGSILFNKNSMRKWYQSGCPPIQVSGPRISTILLKIHLGKTFALNSNKLQEEAMSGEDHADTSPYLPVRRPDAIVRAVTVSEIIEALADGLRDFQSAPGGG